ncbi:MAG: DUF222 domain-containing protein [Ilumatobacteraceae bacterium]
MDEAAAIAVQCRIAELCGHLNVLHAQLVDTIVEALDGELWQQWGIRSPEHWLAWQSGLAPSRARQLVDTARRAAELPVTFAAFADGELSVDQVVTVARHTPAHNDAEVCELAKAASVTQLRSCLSRYVHHLDPPLEAPGAAELVGDRRDHLVAGFDDDGRYTMHVNAPADHGAIIDTALREARDALFNSGHSDVSWLDALVEVCHRSLDTITSPSRRDRYRIYVHLDTDSADGPAHAWLNGGPHLPDSLRAVLCCNGVIQPLWHTAGLPVNVGRARYIVPERTRRLILDRDRSCRHPSCAATTHLDVHHILEWLLDGPTNTDNLLALCPKHHHAYHRGEYAISGNPDIPGHLRFYDHHGRAIPNGATPRRSTGPPPAPPPGKTYAHPTAEALNTHWLNLTA